MSQTFTTALMGSLPRSQRLLEAKEKKSAGTMSSQRYQDILFDETRRMVSIQESADIDVITSGELDRDNYISYVADKVDGIETMTNEELLNYSSEEFKKSYEKSLKERDAEDAGINNPIAVGKINTQAPLNFEEIQMLEALTDKPIKATLPSPYLLTRSLWLTGVSDQVYANREALGKDIRELIINEVKRLISRGVQVIQLDDPILTQIVFTDEEDQTFY